MDPSEEMVALGRYRVVFERDESGAWIVSFPEVTGCHSFGGTLRQARANARDALALFAADAQDAELIEDLRLDHAVVSSLDQVRGRRDRAVAAEREADEATAAAVRRLASEGLALPDVGDLLGLTRTRVQQLLAEPGLTPPAHWTRRLLADSQGSGVPEGVAAAPRVLAGRAGRLDAADPLVEHP